MAYSFDAEPDAPTRKDVQYYAMLGSRGIWQEGWKAAAVHAPLVGTGNFDKDQWELYHVAQDRSESQDLAAQYPEKLAALIDTWSSEAQKNNVLPLDDRSAAETLLANVEIEEGADGVIFAHGSRFGGHSLFLRDDRLHYVYNFLGIEPEQVFASPEPLAPGKYTVGMEFRREGAGENGESLGQMQLYIDEAVVAEGPMRTQPAKFTLSGDGLCVGFDSGDAVSSLYETPGTFSGGEIQFVGVTVEGTPYIDLEAEARRVMMSQ